MKSALLVINLDRSPERLNRTQAQIASLGLEFERLPAVDGRSLSAETLHRHYCPQLNRQSYHAKMTAGEIGCYLSHLKAWRLIVERGLDYAVILEDDVVLGSDFQHTLKMIPFAGDWDVIKLGAVKRRPVVQSRPLGRLNLCRYRKVPISAYAQVVSRRGAMKLLQQRASFGRPVDVDLQHVWETELDVLGLEPFPVRIRTDEISEIGSKPRRTLFGENSLLRLYRQRLRFAWQIHAYHFSRHGIWQTLNGRFFTPPRRGWQPG